MNAAERTSGLVTVFAFALALSVAAGAADIGGRRDPSCDLVGEANARLYTAMTVVAERLF